MQSCCLLPFSNVQLSETHVVLSAKGSFICACFDMHHSLQQILPLTIIIIIILQNFSFILLDGKTFIYEEQSTH